MKYHGGGMNMKQYQTSYQRAFISTSQPSGDRLGKNLSEPQNEDELIFSTPSVIAKNDTNVTTLYRIHSKQASLAIWQTKQDTKQTPSNVPSQAPTSRPFFQTYGNMGMNVRRLPEKRAISQEHLVNLPSQQVTNRYYLMERYTDRMKLDPKLKRTLSQQSRHNFLQFLLVQKVGQSDEQKMLDYLQKEHNYQLPEIPDGQTKLSRSGQRKGRKVTKKGITYLQPRDETDQQLQTQVNQILGANSRRNRQKHEQDNIPLDEYIIRIHENKVRGLKKVQAKQKLADKQIAENSQKNINNPNIDV